MKILSPISILEYGSTCVRLVLYDQNTINNNLFFEEKIDFTRKENPLDEKKIFSLITNAEKNLDQHLNEIILILDDTSIFSLDLCIQKNYEKKIITNDDIDYLIKECETEIKINNKEKDILHIIKSKIILDDIVIDEIESNSTKSSKVNLEIKFILIDKITYDFFKNLFLKKHISLSSIFCKSYIKSLGLINKLDISGYNSFIDIGLKKSCLTIFKDKTLLYINYTHIGGDYITKDISKILKIDYRQAESKKIKFFKKNNKENIINEDEFLKKIINSRLEEIVEILFLNCPLTINSFSNSNLELFFIGNGSKVLNKNLLSFGPEFNFIKGMAIIDENNYDCCNSAIEFDISSKKIQPKRSLVNIENKGFFEKLFSFFN